MLHFFELAAKSRQSTKTPQGWAAVLPQRYLGCPKNINGYCRVTSPWYTIRTVSLIVKNFRILDPKRVAGLVEPAHKRPAAKGSPQTPVKVSPLPPRKGSLSPRIVPRDASTSAVERSKSSPVQANRSSELRKEIAEKKLVHEDLRRRSIELRRRSIELKREVGAPLDSQAMLLPAFVGQEHTSENGKAEETTPEEDHGRDAESVTINVTTQQNEDAESLLKENELREQQAREARERESREKAELEAERAKEIEEQQLAEAARQQKAKKVEEERARKEQEDRELQEELRQEKEEQERREREELEAENAKELERQQKEEAERERKEAAKKGNKPAAPVAAPAGLVPAPPPPTSHL